MAEFGAYLKELRLDHEFGLRAFSVALRMDPGYLSRIERGKLRPPREDNFFEDVAVVLGLDPKDEKINKLRDIALGERFETISRGMGQYAQDVQLIPLLLRTVADKRLSKEDMADLIKEIKENY